MRATFPHRLLWQDVTPRLIGSSLDTQQSVSGVDTAVPSMAGRWEVTASFVIRGEGAQLQWQAFLAQMEGRLGTTLLPIRTKYRPKCINGLPTPSCLTTDLFTAPIFEHTGAVRPSVVTMGVAATPLRATQLRVVFGKTTGVRPGQYFSLGERLYRVQAHWRDDVGDVIQIQPPLRDAIVGSATAILDTPHCLMRFASEAEGDFDQNMDVLPRVTCRFVEAL